jgi:hypothetical protein
MMTNDRNQGLNDHGTVTNRYNTNSYHYDTTINSTKLPHSKACFESRVQRDVGYGICLASNVIAPPGPDLLLQILKKNQELGNRRYGFHVSKLVAACCCRNSSTSTTSQEEERLLQGNTNEQHEQQHSKELFDQLTDMQILPYIESKAAIYLLSIDAEYYYYSNSPPSLLQEH